MSNQKPSGERGLPPLAGIKVIELTTVFAGPGLGVNLADQGADVLKVEPLIGDPSRGPKSPDETAPLFYALNRGKRCLALNIRVPEGRAILEQLLAEADIVTENFRPGVLERQGLDYESLRERFPRLIWVSITGYGEQSAYRERRGYDMVAQAIGGTLSYRHWPDGTPMYSGIALGDNATGIVAMYGVMMALYRREVTGFGQKVNSTLLNAVISLQRPTFIHSESAPASTAYTPRKVPWQAPYRCEDGKYIMVALNVRNEWEDLCRTLDLQHVIDEPRYAFPPYDAGDELMQLLTGIFETKPAEEWVRLLTEGDVPCAVIAAPQEALQNPALREMGQVIPQDIPGRGTYWFAGPSVSLSDNPPAENLPIAAQLGEHTADVLRSLGYTDEQIAGLAERKVVILGG